jgi:hypothetical protein
LLPALRRISRATLSSDQHLMLIGWVVTGFRIWWDALFFSGS